MLKNNTTSTCTKQKIFDAAVMLFNDHGYDGTSVREIAKKANVNVSNISYYFQGKQGLLEECFTQFFEQYLQFIEDQIGQLKSKPADVCLKHAVRDILSFQCENHYLSRFIWREISIDSQVIREIISSYLMKERYFYKILFEQAMEDQIIMKQPISFLVIQLKSMITMPFLNSQQLREVWHVFPHEKYFIDYYMKNIEKWIDSLQITSDGVTREKDVAVL